MVTVKYRYKSVFSKSKQKSSWKVMKFNEVKNIETHCNVLKDLERGESFKRCLKSQSQPQRHNGKLSPCGQKDKNARKNINVEM